MRTVRTETVSGHVTAAGFADRGPFTAQKGTLGRFTIRAPAGRRLIAVAPNAEGAGVMASVESMTDQTANIATVPYTGNIADYAFTYAAQVAI